MDNDKKQILKMIENTAGRLACRAMITAKSRLDLSPFFGVFFEADEDGFLGGYFNS